MLTNVNMLQSQRDEIQNLPFITLADSLLMGNSIISLLPICYKLVEKASDALGGGCTQSDFKTFARLYHKYYQNENDDT